MRKSTSLHGSLLLQHIHGSLPFLQRLYANNSPLSHRGSEAEPRASPSLPAASSASLLPSTAHPSSPLRVFPPDPQSREEGSAVVNFFCQELGIGERPLRVWRQKLEQRVQQRWQIPDGNSRNSNSSTETTTASDSVELPWTPVRVTPSPLSPSTTTTTTQPSPPPPSSSSSTLWLRPRLQDAAVVRSAVRDLRFLVSPLLLLSPPPYTSDAADYGVLGTSPSRLAVPAAASMAPQHRRRRPASQEECSRWYATQPIPAGMFLMSIPTQAVLFAHPPPTSDPLLTYFMHVEELVAQLVEAAATETAPHHGYATYLCDSVVPCSNLPFMTPGELQRVFAQEAAAKSTLSGDEGSLTSKFERHGLRAPLEQSRKSHEEAAESEEAEPFSDSPAFSLLSFFHEDMGGEPLSNYLRSRLSKEEYAWWVSLVLSHRAGSSSLLPMIDKLNHSPLPNCYYTMATEESVCGLDVLDNLFAGVPEELLYQPYVHLFAIRDIAAGEELTLCYASAAEGSYKPAGVHLPPRPASLQGPAPSSSPTSVRHPNTQNVAAAKAKAEEELSSFMEALFPASTSVAAAGGKDSAAGLRRLQHPGRQEVHTAEGSASWRLQWGFVPPCDAVYSARDLAEVAALVAERRVDTRAVLFPPPSLSAQTTGPECAKTTLTAAPV